VDHPGCGRYPRHLRPLSWFLGRDDLHGIPAVGPLSRPSGGPPPVLFPIGHLVLLGKPTKEVAELGHGDCFHRHNILPHTRLANNIAKVGTADCEIFLSGFASVAVA
jgi:hypothetical protein